MEPNIIISSLSLLKKSPIAECFANLGVFGWLVVIIVTIFCIMLIISMFHDVNQYNKKYNSKKK